MERTLKKSHLILLLCLMGAYSAVTIRADAQEQIYQISDFKGGLHTRIDPLLIQANESPSAQNVLFDEDDTLYKRLGYSEYATLPTTGAVLGAHEFTRSSGERWLVVQISSSLYSSKDDGATWTTIKAGLSLINPINYTVYLDELWLTNGFDNVMSYNGSIVTEYSFIPKGKYIITHFDQIFIGNILGEPSNVYFSAVFAGPKTASGWTATNAFSFAKDDGDVITGLSSHRGNIVVFKNKSVWGILGYGDNMDLFQYSKVYGCVSHRSIKEYKNDLIFLSKQGLCAFNGGDIKQIDRKIDGITKTITSYNTRGNLKRWTQNEKSDFSNATEQVNIDLSQESGAVIPLIQDMQSLVEYDNYNKEGPNVGPSDYNMRGVVFATSYPFMLPNLTTTYGAYHSWLELPATGYTLKDLQISFARSGDASTATVKAVLYDCSPNFNWSGNQVTWKGQPIRISSNGISAYVSDIIAESEWQNISLSKTQTFENFFSTGVFLSTYTKIGVIIAAERGAGIVTRDYIHSEFFLRTWKYTFWNVGGDFYRTQIKYKYYYDIAPTTYAYITSAKFNAGIVAQWKNFVALYNGDVSFAYKAAVSSSALDTTEWTPITNGEIIGATTNQIWIQWRANFDRQQQVLYSVNIEWQSTEDNGTDVYACQDNDRYYLLYSSHSVNDNVLLIDNNASFIKWDIQADIIMTYSQNLIILSGTNGKIYKLFDTYNDDGGAIDASWTSKYLDFGLMDVDKSLDRIAVTAKGTGTLEVGYRSNYETAFSTFSIPLNNVTDNWVFNLPMMSAQKYWQIRVRNNAVGERFQIQRINLYYTPAELKSR